MQYPGILPLAACGSPVKGRTKYFASPAGRVESRFSRSQNSRRGTLERAMEGTEMTNAGNSFENDGLPLSCQQRRVRERELWMAMQEAHKRWMHATDVLNSLTLSSAGATVSA